MPDIRVFRIVISPDDSSATLERAGMIIGVYAKASLDENLENVLSDVVRAGRRIVAMYESDAPKSTVLVTERED